jgi:hypothetical protein
MRGLAHDAHALAAAARRGFDQEREAQALSGREQRGVRLVFVVVPGKHRYAGRRHETTRFTLRAHALDCLDRRADEDDTGSFAGAGELRVFRQESVTRMNPVTATLARELHDARPVQVAFARRRRPYVDGFVRQSHVQGVRVRVRVDGYSAQPEPPRRADDAAGDLAPVRNENTSKHGPL